MKMESQYFETTVLYDANTIQCRVKGLAAEIDAYAQLADIHQVVLVIVLKGAAMFGMDLSSQIKTPHLWEFIRAKSYISAAGKMISSGNVQIDKSPIDVNGKDVIIVEDIVDTGLTMKKLLEKIKEDGARSIKTCTLLDKPVNRIYPVGIDFVGFTLDGSPFVLGYGLDVDEKFRNLPFVGVKK
jgi:hypoxanthine phosphoribosyltransferase